MVYALRIIRSPSLFKLLKSQNKEKRSKESQGRFWWKMKLHDWIWKISTFPARNRNRWFWKDRKTERHVLYFSSFLPTLSNGVIIQVYLLFQNNEVRFLARNIDISKIQWCYSSFLQNRARDSFCAHNFGFGHPLPLEKYTCIKLFYFKHIGTTRLPSRAYV